MLPCRRKFSHESLRGPTSPFPMWQTPAAWWHCMHTTTSKPEGSNPHACDLMGGGGQQNREPRWKSTLFHGRKTKRTAEAGLPPPPPSLWLLEAPVRKIILQMHTPARTSQCWSRQTQHGLGVCIWMHLVNGTGNTGNSPSPGRPTPGVVKQDKSSGGSIDTTKTRSGPQRVRMSSGERPIGAANQIPRPCANPPSPAAAA